MPFSPFFTKRPSDFHRLKPATTVAPRALQEDHQVIVEAVTVELRCDLEHPPPVVARGDLGDRVLELVVGGAELVVHHSTSVSR
jgi:hypothetical protein